MWLWLNQKDLDVLQLKGVCLDLMSPGAWRRP